MSVSSSTYTSRKKPPYYLLLGEVEAKNFVLNIGHLWDVCEPVVQPTISRMEEVAHEAHLYAFGGNGDNGGYGGG